MFEHLRAEEGLLEITRGTTKIFHLGQSIRPYNDISIRVFYRMCKQGSALVVGLMCPINANNFWKGLLKETCSIWQNPTTSNNVLIVPCPNSILFSGHIPWNLKSLRPPDVQTYGKGHFPLWLPSKGWYDSPRHPPDCLRFVQPCLFDHKFLLHSRYDRDRQMMHHFFEIIQHSISQRHIWGRCSTLRWQIH